MSELRADAYTQADYEQARKLFSGEATFIAGSTRVDNLPDTSLPEVAFIGRSNVGKSTMLNALTKRNSLARTSRNPGHTRQINFFNVRDQFRIVDLPGYGYARASKKDIAGWTALMHNYLVGRPNLKRAFLLVDARHDIKKSDIDMMSILDEAALSYQIVLTKVDKASKGGVNSLVKQVEQLMERHAALYPDVIATSSKEVLGIDILRCTIIGLLT